MLFDGFFATARAVVMGPGVRRDDRGSRGRHHHRIRRMATVTVTTPHDAVPGAPLAARLSTPQVWGIVMLMPYLLVFLAFVVYPVCYGLWLARHPSSFVPPYNDPIFAAARA